MLERFYECYSDLSCPIPCTVLGIITPLLIPNSRIRLIRLIGLLRWLPYENNNLYMGINGLFLFFVTLIIFLIPICISVGWSSMRSYGKEYITASLILEFLMIDVFCILDPLLFYVLSESGFKTKKDQGSISVFPIYLLGSVFMLLAIPLILLQTGTTDLQISLTTEFSERRQIFLWIASFASFAVKVPMVPVHIWSPEAHIEAPTAGSVILAGIILKLGTYGFLRFSIPMFPEATLRSTPLIYTLSVIAIIYTSSTTSRQIDPKKIIAYSPVAHMNLVTIGMFSPNIEGIGGSIPPMSSHGPVPPSLFLCVGVLYDRHKTRLVRYYGGSVSTMPNISTIFFSSTLANMSSPGTSSFIGEFPILVGAFQRNSLVSTLAALGMILGAAYSLWLYNRAISGNLKPDFLHKFSDPNGREVSIFIPFIVGVVRMGVHPKVFSDRMHTYVSNLVQHGKFH
ncbi:hypothetical protein C5167_029863 [Papaver somniferum]|nr:hypothetical protein C5167_029863 [Papaver somniferum]